MSLQESIERLRALDDQHPDWGNTLDDVDPQMIADIVAVVRDRIALADRWSKIPAPPPFTFCTNEEYARIRSQ